MIEGLMMFRNTTLYISQRLTPSLSLFLFILNILSNPTKATNTTKPSNTTQPGNSTHALAPNDDIKLAEIFGSYAGIILVLVVSLVIARITIGHGLGPAKRAATSNTSNDSEDNPKNTSSSIVSTPSPSEEKPDTPSFSSRSENDAAEEEVNSNRPYNIEV